MVNWDSVNQSFDRRQRESERSKVRWIAIENARRAPKKSYSIRWIRISLLVSGLMVSAALIYRCAR